MKSNRTDFLSFSAEEFCRCIAIGDKISGEAAYYLIHNRMKGSLEALYCGNNGESVGELDDTLDDFFLYLHGGIDGRKPFATVRTVLCPEALFGWVESTYLNFLNNEKRKGRVRHTPYYNVSEGTSSNDASKATSSDDVSKAPSSLSYEQQIQTIATAIAYCDQTSLPENRFLVFRWLLSQLEPQRSMGNEVVAKSLHISHVAYRVQTHRLKTKLVNDVMYLVAGGTLSLDEEHQAMRDTLSDRFEHLYEELYRWYENSIENHPLRDELLALDRKNGHLHETPCEWPLLSFWKVLFSG